MFLTLFYNNADQNIKGKQFSRGYQTINTLSRISTNMTVERCNDCGLLHEQGSVLASSNNSTSSLQKDQVKQESSRCPRCNLLHSFLCVSLDNLDIRMDDSCCSHVNLDNSVEWDNFLIQAQSTKKMDWVCSWDQFQKVPHESSHYASPLLQPATLVSCALQALDEAGHLDFNIQDPCSMEVALMRIGAVDQIPVEELSMVHRRTPKRVSFNLPEADSVLDTSSKGKQFALKEVLEHTLKSLSKMQTLALDVMFDSDQTDWLNNSLILNFETAICSMNPLQSLAVAVKAGYINIDSLPEFVDSNFITRNSHMP